MTALQSDHNVTFPLCLIKYAPRHEEKWGIVGVAPSFLTPARYGSEDQLHIPTDIPQEK
jgi:hypothetical protein